jgi:hypothetical protein
MNINLSTLHPSEFADIRGIVSSIYRTDLSSVSTYHIIERLLNQMTLDELAMTSDNNAVFLLSMVRRAQS